MQRWISGGALALVAALAMVAVGTMRVARADPRDFTLINDNPTVTLTHVFVASSDSADWGDDILGQDTLAPGESVSISFARFVDGDCLYDIKVIYQDGGEGYLYKVNLCETDTVTFS